MLTNKERETLKSIRIQTVVRNLCSTIAMICIIGVVALAGEPAPGEAEMSAGQFVVSELICCSAAFITGTLAVRANQRIQYLLVKKNRVY